MIPWHMVRGAVPVSVERHREKMHKLPSINGLNKISRRGGGWGWGCRKWLLADRIEVWKSERTLPESTKIISYNSSCGGSCRLLHCITVPLETFLHSFAIYVAFLFRRSNGGCCHIVCCSAGGRNWKSGYGLHINKETDLSCAFEENRDSGQFRK